MMQQCLPMGGPARGLYRLGNGAVFFGKAQVVKS